MGVGAGAGVLVFPLLAMAKLRERNCMRAVDDGRWVAGC